jgi:hypothetical protein
LVCNSNYHSPSCPSYKNNSLKGASEINNQPKQLLKFHESEINLLNKSLELCRYFIGKTQAQYQNPADILKDIDSAITVLEAHKSNQKIYVLKK